VKRIKKSYRLFLTLIVLLSITTLAIFTSEPKSSSGPLPPSIMPVVILQGSDYEMGYQYGQQAGPILVMRKEASWATVLNKQSREDVLHTLKAYQWYIRKYAPEIIEEMKGMAAGARDAGYDLTYVDVLLLNAGQRNPGPAWNYPKGAEDEKLPMGCSTWAAWGSTTVDGRLIGGDSQDRTFFHAVVMVVFPDSGNRYVNPSIAGYLAHKPSMNDKGVFVGQTLGMGDIGRDLGDYGIPFHSAILPLMRFADSAEEAKNMLLSWKIDEDSSWLIADVKGNAYVVELTSTVKSVRKAGDFGETEFIYCTNNYFNEEMKEVAKDLTFTEHAGWASGNTRISSISRNKELWTMFTRYHGKINLDFAKMMWRFTGDPPPYPVDDEFMKAYHAGLGKGWNAKICNLSNSSVGIALPDNGDKGIMYICTGPAGKGAYLSTPRGKGQFQIAGTHTFYELTLADNPVKVVNNARDAAFSRISEVHVKMMKLNYTDPGYVALNELFSKAKAEYYEGLNWNYKANLADGNDALALYAKAATAFTRSQAHAIQVYHALVPPASRPEDLGLEPYKETAWDDTQGNDIGKEKNSN
jgi:hypothetical protein